MAQCAARKMVAAEKRSGGCIVNVSSQASMKAIAEHAFYAASKAGMDMMTKVMALELGKHNVRAGSVIVEKASISPNNKLHLMKPGASDSMHVEDFWLYASAERMTMEINRRRSSCNWRSPLTHHICESQ